MRNLPVVRAVLHKLVEGLNSEIPRVSNYRFRYFFYPPPKHLALTLSNSPDLSTRSGAGENDSDANGNGSDKWLYQLTILTVVSLGDAILTGLGVCRRVGGEVGLFHDGKHLWAQNLAPQLSRVGRVRNCVG